MSKAIVMIGVPGSGKSTEALRVKKELEINGLGETRIISSDAIREELLNDINDQTQNERVFKEVHNRIRQAVKDKANLIVDATNITIKSRAGILNCLENSGYEKVAYIIPTPKAICLARNKIRDRVVPEWVIERQIKKFEFPFYNEGFDKIKVLGWSDDSLKGCSFNPDNNTILNCMKNFDQKTHHHKYTLDKHCIECAKELAKRTNNKVLIRAGYVHDIGKIFTQELKEDNSGECRYHSHHNVGTYTLLQNLDCLGFDNMEDVFECLFYVNYHMQPFFIYSEKAEQKWKKIFGEEYYNNLSLFNECDVIASGRE